MPAAATSLVVVVEDADSPTPHPLVHAIVVDLPPADGALAEGALPSADHEGDGAAMPAATPTSRRPGCRPIRRPAMACTATPSRSSRSATAPAFSATPGRDEVFDALRAHAIASGLLIGTCERPDGSIKLPESAPAGPLVAG